jgi:hypothetical protein
MDTLLKDAGIDLMKTMSLIKGRRGTQLQPRQPPTMWIQIGMLIQELQIT